MRHLASIQGESRPPIGPWLTMPYFYRSAPYLRLDPLHCTRSDPAFSRGFQYPFAAGKRGTDCIRDLGVYPRPADRLPLLVPFSLAVAIPALIRS
jgi:hypothetical protein